MSYDSQKRISELESLVRDMVECMEYMDSGDYMQEGCVRCKHNAWDDVIQEHYCNLNLYGRRVDLGIEE